MKNTNSKFQNVALTKVQIKELIKLKIHPREILREVVQRLLDKNYQDTIKKEVIK